VTPQGPLLDSSERQDGERTVLSENAIALYLHASVRDDWTLEGASAALGLTVGALESAREELLRNKLLRPLHEGGPTLGTAAPDIALAELVDEDERRVLELRAAIAQRRSELMALVPAYRSARSALAGTEHVEVVQDPATVLRLLLDLERGATREILIAAPGTSSVERHDASDGIDRGILARGVARRTLYHDRRRDHAATRRSVEHLEPLGAEFRTLPLVPFRMVVFDRALAVVSRGRDDDDRAALIVRSPDLAAAFARVFDAAWQFATPFSASPADAGARLSAVQRSVLTGLAAGLTDDALAARLGISVRTCRRHIAALFDLLGAESRFQAGVFAAQRGLLPGPSPH